jgi:hypothetical protein
MAVSRFHSAMLPSAKIRHQNVPSIARVAFALNQCAYRTKGFQYSRADSIPAPGRLWSNYVAHGSDRGRLRFAGNVLLPSQVDQMAAESPEGFPP